MLPRILDVPRRNSHVFCVQSGAHFTLGLIQMSGVNEPIQNSGLVQIELMEKAETISFRVDRLGERTKKVVD